MGRVAETGTFEYKSVSNLLGQESTGSSLHFMDWSLNNLRSVPNDKGQAVFRPNHLGLERGSR